MKKMSIMLLFMSCTITIVAKTDYKPSFVMKSSVSKEVQDFLDANNANTKTKIVSKRDVLGRRNSNVQSAYLTTSQDNSIDVWVCHVGQHEAMNTYSGRYDVSAEKSVQFFLNAELTLESSYIQVGEKTFTDSSSETLASSMANVDPGIYNFEESEKKRLLFEGRGAISTWSLEIMGLPKDEETKKYPTSVH